MPLLQRNHLLQEPAPGNIFIELPTLNSGQLDHTRFSAEARNGYTPTNEEATT